MSYINLEIGNIPGSAPTNSISVYPKVDGKLYLKDENGVEYPLAEGEQGPQGIQGPEGDQGLVGPQGVQGIQGATGPTGSQGIQGISGLDGRTILSGTIDPDVSVGADGDFYLNTSTYDFFGPKVSGAWGSGAPLGNGQPQEFFEYINGTAPSTPISGRTRSHFNTAQDRLIIQRPDNSLTPIIEINKETLKIQPLPDDEFVIWSESENAYRKVQARNAIPKSLQLRYVTFDEDDFIASTTTGKLGWGVSTSGAGASVQFGSYGANALEKAVGVIQLDTGSTSNGRAVLSRSVNLFALGYFKIEMIWRIALEELSTSTERFVIYLGMIDNTGAGAPVDGVYFFYSDQFASQWQCVCRESNIQTVITTSVEINTNYSIFKIVVNENATQANFFINDSLVATINSNIPSTAGNFTGIGARIEKVIGSTQRNMSIDYYSHLIEFTGGRQS